MSKFGAYREGMAPFAFGDDVWTLIGRMVPLAAREGWLPELRVGLMVDPNEQGIVHDLMIGEWGEIIAIGKSESTDLSPVNMTLIRVDELYKDFCSIEGAEADWATSAEEAEKDFEACWGGGSEYYDVGPRLEEWALKHIKLSPAYCDGRYPLPGQRIDGVWSYPRNRAHDLVDAEIEFELESGAPVWFCAGTGVQKPSLAVAMDAVDVHLMEAL